jgi:hypothetical protein
MDTSTLTAEDACFWRVRIVNNRYQKNVGSITKCVNLCCAFAPPFDADERQMRC